MVDLEARAQVGTNLRRLITGRMTNDQFDDFYYQLDSDDNAIREIAGYGYCLYSSDLPLPYRLKGRHAVDTDTRRTAARAILFLQTELEYEWPPDVQGVAPFWMLYGPGCYLLVAPILIFIAVFSASMWQTFTMGVLGFLAIASVVHWLVTRNKRLAEVEQFQAHGELDVWPFCRAVDFENAKKKPRFLAGVSR